MQLSVDVKVTFQQQPDIRKWFMKKHDKGNDNGNASKPAKPTLAIPGKPSTAKDASAASAAKSVSTVYRQKLKQSYCSCPCFCYIHIKVTELLKLRYLKALLLCL